MLENFQQLLAFQELLKTLKLDRKAYASPDYSRMRFKLGTSLAETKVPYEIEPALKTVLKTAIDTLFLAVPMRHRDDMGPAELDAVLLDPGAMNVSLRPPTWYIGDVPADSVFYRIITRSMTRSRRLDAGLLLWWLGKDAPGRTLINELNRYINKLENEGKERGAGEETLRLGILALVDFWSKYRSVVSERANHPVIIEGYNAAALVHFEVLRALLEERYRPLGIPERPIGDPAAAAYHALTLPLSPLMACEGVAKPLLDDVNPFGVGRMGADALERFFPKMLDRATPPAEVAKQLTQKLAGDKTASGIVLGEMRRQQLYAAALQLLWKLKPGDEKSPEYPIFQEIRRILKEPNDLFKALDDKKAGKEWQETWKKLTIDAYRAPMDAFLTSVLAAAKLSDGFFSDKAALQNAFTEYCKRFVVLRNMEGLNAALLEQRRFLQPFGGTKEQAAAEYGNGRLYRFAADDNLTLQAGADAKEAQLFIDLKDFTKRTFSSKEMAMADFMKWEFYDPILKAGKKYMLDMAHLDNHSLAINNLLGDAVLASGSVLTLVRFAYDVLSVADDYRDKLKQKMPAALVEAKLRELDAAFAKDKAALVAEYNKFLAPAQKLTAEMNALPPQDPKRTQLGAQIRGYQEAAGSAQRRLKQLTTDYQDKRETIVGTGLEAGAYIAFGTAAETIVFKDEAFGNLRVAIGEKINESARGTAREVTVRDTLTYIVDRARQMTKNPEMEYPFRVFVDNMIKPVLDPDLELLLQKALKDKDAEGVKKAVTTLSQRLMSDLVNNVKREQPEFRSVLVGNGIYNLGLAVSGDAFEAYLKIVEGRRTVTRRDLVVNDLHEEIKRRFIFPRERYPMVLVSPEEPGQPVEIYVNMGSMVFKGFEKAEPQVVWENLLHKTLFYKMLAKHHLSAWMGVPA